MFCLFCGMNIGEGGKKPSKSRHAPHTRGRSESERKRVGCTNKTRVRAGGRSQSATDKTTTQTYFTEMVILFTLRQVGKRERARRDGMGWVTGSVRMRVWV